MRLVRLLIPMVFLPLAWCQTPGLVYSRTLGVLTAGISISGIVNAIAVDAAGNAYLAGSTQNAAFPVTPGAPQTAFGGGTCNGGTYNPFLLPLTYPCDDAFVLELDPKGNVLFSTFLGGSGADIATSIALDSAGNIYVAGRTASTGQAAGHNFPTTAGSPFGDSATGYAFLTKINPKSGLVYSYLLPGVHVNVLVAVDSQGSAYFAGNNIGFAVTPGALQGKGDVVVGKLNPAGTKLLYGAQFGGANGIIGDGPTGFAVDASGNAYITGSTLSSDFPVTAGAFQTTAPNLQETGFAAKLNPSGSALLYGTYLGGSDFDMPLGIRVDAQGKAYVFGETYSADFPVTSGGYKWDATRAGEAAFLTVLQPDGSAPALSTFVAGALGYSPVTTDQLGVNSIDIDGSGNIFLAGKAGPGLHVTAGATQSCAGGAGFNMFAAKLTPQGSLAAATYLGGSQSDSANVAAVNPDGTVTLAGMSLSPDFPVTAGPEPYVDYVVARLQIADPSRPDAPCMALAPQNAASLVQGPVAPGELITLRGNHFGPDAGVAGTVDSSGLLPTSLAGVQVFFDGTPVPLLYVQSQQINAQVPFEFAGRQSTTFHVEYRGVATKTAQTLVRDQAPDLFRQFPSMQGVIFNSDGSPNSPANPAPVGSTVWILGTGGGLFAPPLRTGAMTPMAPLSQLATQPVVLIDDATPAQVQYAGSSPTAPSGVFQINFVVPPIWTYSATHTVDVRFGPIATDPFQTVSIAIKP